MFNYGDSVPANTINKRDNWTTEDVAGKRIVTVGLSPNGSDENVIHVDHGEVVSAEYDKDMDLLYVTIVNPAEYVAQLKAFNMKGSTGATRTLSLRGRLMFA